MGRNAVMRLLSTFSIRHCKDPRMKLACIFPGQGSQTVGMGKALYDHFASAREVFQEIDDVLSQKLSKLMFEGPESDLTLTENAQPAIMAVSLAATRVLEKEAGFIIADKATFVAGHSLGEYSALAAAGACSVAETARLLRIRGNAMQKAAPAGTGAMAALLGLEMAQVEAIVKEASAHGVCDIANDNSPGQLVISGTKEAVEAAMELAKAQGCKRALLLNVSAPFHSSLMQPAADAMKEALATAALHAPAVPVIDNITVQPVTDPAIIRDLLVKQVTGRVRWTETIHYMKAQGIDTLIEIGEGKVLSGLAKRIEKNLVTYNINGPEDIETLVKAA